MWQWKVERVACSWSDSRVRKCVHREREFFLDNLLVRIHFIIVMIRWTGLAPWGFEFPFPGSLASTFTSAYWRAGARHSHLPAPGPLASCLSFALPGLKSRAAGDDVARCSRDGGYNGGERELPGDQAMSLRVRFGLDNLVRQGSFSVQSRCIQQDGRTVDQHSWGRAGTWR